MDSVLSTLYDGDFIPPIQFSPDGEAYEKLRLDYCRRQDAFRKKLRKINPDLDEQFNQIVDEQAELASMENEAMFRDSFRLGARLIMEVLFDDPE